MTPEERFALETGKSARPGKKFDRLAHIAKLERGEDDEEELGVGQPDDDYVEEAAPAPVAPAANPARANAVKQMSPEALERYRRAVQSGGFNRRLPARQMEGFQIRFVNDDAGRVQQFVDTGWDFVTNKEQGMLGKSTDPGDKYSVVVGSTTAGAEMRAYLLKIPQEWYDQFKRIEMESVAQVDKVIKRGGVNAKAGDGRYIPKSGIKVQTGRT